MRNQEKSRYDLWAAHGLSWLMVSKCEFLCEFWLNCQSHLPCVEALHDEKEKGCLVALNWVQVNVKCDISMNICHPKWLCLCSPCCRWSNWVTLLGLVPAHPLSTSNMILWLGNLQRTIQPHHVDILSVLTPCRVPSKHMGFLWISCAPRYLAWSQLRTCCKWPETHVNPGSWPYLRTASVVVISRNLSRRGVTSNCLPVRP